MSDVVRRRLEALADELGGESGPERTSPPQATAEPDPAPRRALSAGAVERGLAFGREHLVAVAIIALAGVAWALLSMTQARTLPVAVAAPTPVESLPAPTASPTPRAIQVHVLGAVERPGVVRVADGSRVHEAIAAAGGLTVAARPGDLNLAAPVSDGAQIVIGTTREPGGRVQGAAGEVAGSTSTARPPSNSTPSPASARSPPPASSRGAPSTNASPGSTNCRKWTASGRRRSARSPRT